MRKILSLIIIVACVISTHAQSPESFKYQAVVRDAGGNVLANQGVGVQIEILEGSATGTVVYTETFTPTTNSFGLINLEIGTGTTGDDFTIINWANNSYFVETGVDPAGGTSYSITGVSQLLSVPYALQAKRAQWQNTADGLAYTTGRVGIGTSTADITDTSILEVRANSAGATTNLRLINDHPDGSTQMAFTNNVTAIASNDLLLGINNETSAAGPNEGFLWYVDDFDFKIGTGSIERLRIRDSAGNGNIEVKTGDVYIENIGSGVIIKSPDGNCWRMTVSNAGAPVFATITCP